MIDFEKEFEQFVTDDSGSAIRDIYTIIPSMNQQQLKIISTLKYYANKYNNKELLEFINDYLINMKKNKNLGFLSSMNMKSLLKAYTADEMIRGIKASVNHMEER